MLGGYYLGQLYLGVSGLPSSGSLTVQDSSHSHSVDNITLIQQHFIALDDALHSLTSDNLDLTEHKTLVVDTTIHSLTSDNIDITQAHTIVVSDTTHGLTSDNITLLQQHLLEVQNTLHDHAADGNLVLNEFFLLNQPDPGAFLVTSPEIWVVQHHTVEIENTYHSLVDTLTRIINWADYNRFEGILIKDFKSDGDIESGELESGVLGVQRHQSQDTLAPAEVESGIFITDFTKFGKYH